MRVTYFDEVKANPQNGHGRYTVGGLSIPSDDMAGLERQINNLAEEIFGTRNLALDTEFHAAHIYAGKAHFRGMDVERRVELLGRLGEIISAAERVKRVYAAVHTDRMHTPELAPEIAFAYFCERVQRSLGTEQTLLIGDHDDQFAKAMISAFARYRESGTPYPYGLQLTGLLDAVHFARSHHSRLLQLADVYLFLYTHRWGSRKGWQAEKLSERLGGLELWPHRYKEWPKER